jgi:hypothetical protein
MCDICRSMLVAEHTERPGADLCPKCRRFPLDVEAPLDLSQWDYVEPDFRDAVESDTLAPPEFTEPMPEQELESSEDQISEEGDEEIEEAVRTCYHCYQADSELAELCLVWGDSYLPPSQRQPHKA